MEFFEDIHGTLRPVGAIREIRRGEWKDDVKMRGRGKVELTYGSPATVEDYTIDLIVTNSQPVIPAHPGFVVVAMWGKSGPADQMFTDEWPVVAWRVDEYGSLAPVVPDEHFQGMKENFAIQYPDGKVVLPMEGMSFATREDWETEMRERAEAYRDEAAKEAAAVHQVPLP